MFVKSTPGNRPNANVSEIRLSKLRSKIPNRSSWQMMDGASDWKKNPLRMLNMGSRFCNIKHFLFSFKFSVTVQNSGIANANFVNFWMPQA